MEIIITIFVFLLGIFYILNRWDEISLKNIEFRRYLEKERVFAGEPVKLTTEITNNKLLILPWIIVNNKIPKEVDFKDQRVLENNDSEKTYRIVTTLLSYQRIKKTNTIYCNKRGYFSFQDVNLSVGDFFGFATASKEIHYPMNLIVYPLVKPLEKLIIPSRSIQGEVSVRRWIIPDNLAIIGTREYTPYDSFNDIDWKATARTNKLQVKKFDYTADLSIFILLNVQTSDVYWQNVNTELIEKGIDIAASITEKAINEKIEVGYSSNAFFYGDNKRIFIRPKSGKNQKMFIFEALAKTSYLPIDRFEEFINKNIKLIDKNNVIILITGHISKDLIKTINHLLKLNYYIKLILLDNSLKLDGLTNEVDIIYSQELK